MDEAVFNLDEFIKELALRVKICRLVAQHHEKLEEKDL
jgi:hypothetical protein